MDSMYIYLQSNDSIELYPDNNGARFTVRLPKRLHMSGTWTCALCEIHIPPIHSQGFTWTPALPIAVCSTLCAGSVLTGMHVPVLRQIILSDQEQREGTSLSFNPLYYIPIVQADLEAISIYLKTTPGFKFSLGDQLLYCLLHLRKEL